MRHILVVAKLTPAGKDRKRLGMDKNHRSTFRRGEHHAIRSHPAARAWRAALPVLAMCALASCGDAVRDESGTVTDAGVVNADETRVGDCLIEPAELANSDEAVDIGLVDVVPCDQPHDLEAYSEFAMTDGEYPGDDAVLVFADNNCLNAYETFVGLAYEDSELDIAYFYPSESTWGLGDRRVTCLIGLPGAKVEGTLAGSAR